MIHHSHIESLATGRNIWFIKSRTEWTEFDKSIFGQYLSLYRMLIRVESSEGEHALFYLRFTENAAVTAPYN